MDFARKYLTKGNVSFIIKRVVLGEEIMITTDELLKETGISYPTLTRLKDLGVIPKPSKQGLGNKRGVIGVFPDEVVSIINWVKQEQKYGLSLVEIAEKYRQRRVISEEDRVLPPNPDRDKWTIDLFAKYEQKYSDDDLIYSTISEIRKEEDGTILIRLRRESIPRR